MTKLDYLLLSLQANPDPEVMRLNIEDYLRARDEVSHAEQTTTSDEPLQVIAAKAVELADLKATVFDLSPTNGGPSACLHLWQEVTNEDGERVQQCKHCRRCYDPNPYTPEPAQPSEEAPF